MGWYLNADYLAKIRLVGYFFVDDPIIIKVDTSPNNPI